MMSMCDRGKGAGLIGLMLIAFCLFGQAQERREVDIPDILGYQTLACDFHMHSIFSDGEVWPTVRVREAWQEGLDAIAITDHIEYLPYRKDVSTDLNRPYQIALPTAQDYRMVLIQGGEITRRMPPGHWNAIFLSDVNALKQDDWRDAMLEAINQGAFLFWNHPGWRGQQKDGIARWYDEHTELYEQAWMMGIEVVNFREYYPEVHQWCLEKQLTMLANSDIHAPIGMGYDFAAGEHRPMTLVFAEEKSAGAIHDALRERRTAVYWQDTLIAEAQYLEAIFEVSAQVLNPELVLQPGQVASLQIHNHSEIPFHLRALSGDQSIKYPVELVLPAHRTVRCKVSLPKEATVPEEALALEYTVENLLVAPDRGLPVKLEIAR